MYAEADVIGLALAPMRQFSRPVQQDLCLLQAVFDFAAVLLAASELNV